MGIVLGALAAVTYGAADFIGGLMTRRHAHVLTVVLLSQAIGGVALLPALAVVSGDLTRRTVVTGLSAGIFGAIGIVLLYAGLARGRMSVVAPVVAVLASIVPVGVGLLIGERPSPLAMAGVAVAMGAVGLVSTARDYDPRDVDRKRDLTSAPGASGLTEAVGAGIALGVFYVVLSRGGIGSGLYPVAFARISSLAFVGAVVGIKQPPLRPAGGSILGIGTAGVLEVAAHALYLIASRKGLLSLVAVVASMYPASTVILARVVLRERFTWSQMAGLLLAVPAIALIATG